MKVHPLGDRVLIRVEAEGDEKIGSILVPDTAKEKPERGEVAAVGPGRRTKQGGRLEMPVSPGDTVLYARWAGTEVDLDGETYLVLKETDILAIL